MSSKTPPPITAAVKEQQLQIIRASSKVILREADDQLAQASKAADRLRKATDVYKEREEGRKRRRERERIEPDGSKGE